MPSNNVLDEKKTLLELSNGNEVAFEKIYQFLGERIYCKLCRLLKSEVIAEEILQDVFLTVWNNRSKLKLEKSFCSYIFCIATNKCYDYFRTVKRNKKLLRELNLSSTYSNTTAQEFTEEKSREMLYDAIELLPPKRKLIFKLCKIEGKSYEQISLQLGVSSSTISDHIVKANRFIKNQLLNKENNFILL
jgi:RNA polymerase sigma-70 factor (ECF subfamily)